MRLRPLTIWAAVIVEPYQGTAGFVFPPEGWLTELDKWARGRNLLLIVDEVQASFGTNGQDVRD